MIFIIMNIIECVYVIMPWQGCYNYYISTSSYSNILTVLKLLQLHINCGIYNSPHRGLIKLGRVNTHTLVKSQAPVYTNPLDLAVPFSFNESFKSNIGIHNMSCFYHYNNLVISRYFLIQYHNIFLHSIPHSLTDD